MLKDVHHLLDPDPVYTETGGFGGIAIEQLHHDMSKFDLPAFVPEGVRRCHDAVRHAYIYSYFSYGLLTLAASQMFPCLELALRERIGDKWNGRTHKDGKPRPPKITEMLKEARDQKLISRDDIVGLYKLRHIFQHGSDVILDPNAFLNIFEDVTCLIRELYEPNGGT